MLTRTAGRGLPALPRASRLERFERPAPHNLHTMTLKAFGKVLSGARVSGIYMNGKHIVSSIIFLDAHSAHTGHLEEAEGMTPLEFPQLLFGSHHRNITQPQAKVTPK